MNGRVFAPLNKLPWVDHALLTANDYNPNRVTKENLQLLTRSIIVNGFTQPIVVRPDFTIQDGYHRWTVSGPEWNYIPSFSKQEAEDLSISKDYLNKTLHEILGGKVPVATVEHKTEAGYMYGTITHNRARGTHLLEPMKAIIRRLVDAGRSVDEIGKQLGMRPEEIFRLSDFSKEDFLMMMVKKDTPYSQAEVLTIV